MENVVVLAGGQGKRMKAEIPKPMFEVLCEPMIGWVIKSCKSAGLENLCIVTGYQWQIIEEYIAANHDYKYETVLQEERLGTGHAVMQAIPFMKKNPKSNTLVLCGDAPFIDSETIAEALKLHTEEGNAVTVITSETDNPTGYGRILRGEKGIKGIVEEKDATPAQREIKEINSGAYWFETEKLIEYLSMLTQNNTQGEYYLTDTIFIAIDQGFRAGAYKSTNPNVALGANSQKDLLELNTIARLSVIERHLENGVEFNCIDGITIGRDVKIGVGSKIGAGTLITGKTTIGACCNIGRNCIISDCEIGDDVTLNAVQAYQSVIEDDVKIGPFVHIRPNSIIKSGVKIGDFVEVKNSVIGEKTSVAHLTYIGDSDVGSGVNFGCGVVTVNYDGVTKNRCVIGDNCFIGCNTNLIAPVTLGNYVYTGAGSTVNKDVPDYALAIERGSLAIKQDYTKRKFNKKFKN